jgi:hypothetical protein
MLWARRSVAAPPSAIHRGGWGDVAARRAPAPPAVQAPLRSLPVLTLLLALWACGRGSLITVITHRPASDLRLALTIRGQYQHTPTVSMQVQIFDGASPQTVFLPNGAHLTCNGGDIKPTPETLVHLCSRQAPGGTYQIAYADEHGAVTTLLVPVPYGEFAIRSPQVGAVVQIPTNGALEVRFATPIPTGGMVSFGSTTAWCGVAPTLCGAVMLDPTHFAYPTPSVAPASAATSTVATGCAAAPAPQTPLVTMSEGGGVAVLTGDYSAFQPGPGTIDVSMTVCETPGNTGFASATVTFSDTLSVPITWSR